LELMTMSDANRTVYFRGLDGIHAVLLPATDALLAVRHHPVEWSLTLDGHAQAPDGFVFSEGDGGGIGAGASVRAD
jgi:hypothetical protein